MKKILLTLVIILIVSQFAYSKPPWSIVDGRGLIKAAVVKYDSTSPSTTVDVSPGYGECDSFFWEITTETSVSITDPNQDDFIYIYIDGSTLGKNDTNPDIVASTDEPSWDDSKFAWYRQSTGNESDRCIGVVWWDDSAGEVAKFIVTGKNESLEYIMESKIVDVVSDGDPDGSWQEVTTHSDYVPTNAIASLLSAHEERTSGTGASLQICALELDGVTISPGRFYLYASVGNSNGIKINKVDWVELGASRDISWNGSSYDDQNSTQIRVQGFRIER